MSYLTIGHLYTALHAACASGVARVIEANGEDVAYADLGHDERLHALDNGEIDILVSAWFPQDQVLLEHGHEAIGSLYHPELGLAALKGTSEGEDWSSSGAFSSILTTVEAQPFLETFLQKHPQLKDLSVDVVPQEAVISHLERAKDEGKKPLIAIWQPHAAFHAGLIELLPNGDLLEGQQQTAKLVLRKGLRDEVDDDLLDELSIMMLSNKVMSALDYAVSVDGMDPEAAAESWQRGRLIPR